MTDDKITRGENLSRSGKYTPAAERNGQTDRDASLLTGMFNGAWLDQQEFLPLEYAVPGIIPEGFGVLAAPPKTGKSWLVCNIGLACAAGGTALGRITVTQRPVLYLALEDGQRRLQTRCRRIMANQPLPDGIDFIIRADNSTIAFGMICEFLTRHRDDKPLIILDTLGRAKPVRPTGADPYQFDYNVGVQLKTAVDKTPGATLLVVHHTRKAESSDFLDAVSGTQGIAGSADFVIVLMRKRHSDDAFLNITGRDVVEAEYAFTVTDGIWSLAGRTLAESASEAETRRERQQLGDRALEVLGFVNGRAETRAADLAALAIGKEQARVYLNRLAESGRIDKIGRGVFKPSREGKWGGVMSVTSVTSQGRNVTAITDITDITPLVSGPGRCDECGWHVDKQGHRDDCAANSADGDSPF
jgi:AAA domain